MPGGKDKWKVFDEHGTSIRRHVLRRRFPLERWQACLLLAMVAAFSACRAGRHLVPFETRAPKPVEHWRNEDPEARTVRRFDITRSGETASIHAWARCVSTECDWGSTNMVEGIASESALWDQGFAVRLLEITWVSSPQRVKVVLRSRFTGGSESEYTMYFVREVDK